MDQERHLSTSKLFGLWAGDELHSWERAVGATVTHLSRGKGQVTGVSRAPGGVAIHVQYLGAAHDHAPWEFRTELTAMTLPDGLTREQLIPPVKTQRLDRERETRLASEAARASREWRDRSSIEAG